ISYNQPTPGPGDPQSRVPFPAFNLYSSEITHDGDAHYNAMELQVRKTSAHYTVQYSHTWAKNTGRENAPYGVTDTYNTRLFPGPTENIPHVDKFHFIVDLPIGKGRSWLNRGGVADAVVGGWTLSGLALFNHSTYPLTVQWVEDTAN